jgi:perosamine synthetase
LAYLALGLQPGDEVIVPGFGFMAAANVALQAGLRPIFADIHPATWCVTANEIGKKITRKTRAIVPIHTYGNVCDMETIMALAREQGIAVIEDCAEALLSKYAARYCGTFGDINTFSLHATKTITTGEGGLVATNDDALASKGALYRSHGLSKRGTYHHEVAGLNFRMTNLQAALGCGQIERRREILCARRRVYLRYKAALEGADGVMLQEFEPPVEPVVWAVALKLDKRSFPQGRDAVAGQLMNKGIETRPGFVASSFLSIYELHRLPIAEEISRWVISLPTFATITDEQIDFVSGQLLRLRKR